MAADNRKWLWPWTQQHTGQLPQTKHNNTLKKHLQNSHIGWLAERLAAQWWTDNKGQWTDGMNREADRIWTEIRNIAIELTAILL